MRRVSRSPLKSPLVRILEVDTPNVGANGQHISEDDPGLDWKTRTKSLLAGFLSFQSNCPILERRGRVPG